MLERVLAQAALSPLSVSEPPKCFANRLVSYSYAIKGARKLTTLPLAHWTSCKPGTGQLNRTEPNRTAMKRLGYPRF